LGDYEIRYVTGQSKRTLTSRPIVLVAVQGSIDAPAEAIAGSEVEVSWTGPNNKSDYITIVEASAKEGKYGDYEYTHKGMPLSITAPDGLGDYEIRYVMGQSKRTLVARKIKLLPLSGALVLSNIALPGGEAIVEWTGPNYSGDYLTIVEKGSPEGAYTDYEYTKRGTPITLDVPRALGTFEIRYIVGQSRRTLATLEIELRAAVAHLVVNTPVAAGSVVEVNWEGPDNQDDFIEIVAIDATPELKPLSAARTAQGSPLSLFAPSAAGDYEVRYMMRGNKEILAVTPLVVE
jgi:Ca-activated chloride channel family protein